MHAKVPTAVVRTAMHSEVPNHVRHSGPLDTDVLEGCEFSKKFRVETSGDMEKLMACVGH